jgi:hypothetical protein
LRLGASQTLFVRVADTELAFKRSAVTLFRQAGENQASRLQWSFGNRPTKTTIVESRARAIEQYLQPLLASGGLPRRLSGRIHLAARWIGASATKAEPDDKVIALCTALEALLASKDDGRKGEIIAIRSMLLPAAIGEGFTDPYPLYALYVRRSDVIHGTKLGVCGEEDYRLLHFEATLALKNMLAVLARHPEVTTFRRLIELIETPEALESAQGWFARYGRFARDVAKVVEERRTKAAQREGKASSVPT